MEAKPKGGLHLMKGFREKSGQFPVEMSFEKHLIAWQKTILSRSFVAIGILVISKCTQYYLVEK